jgi:hypothetical protein
MANSAGVCTSFKVELMKGHHNFGTGVTRGTTTKDTFYGALFLTSATISPATTVYATTGEVSGANYTAGGAAVTNGTEPTSSGTSAVWTPSASLAWTNVTLGTAFNTLLLYNSTQTGKAVAVYTFGDQTVNAGNFTLTMPVNDSSTALLRIA